jgi:hypothetical protein
MAAKRTPPPARALRSQYPTGTAELAATAGDQYRVVVEGPEIVDPILGKLMDASRMVRGIRGPDGKFDARPGMTESAVYDEVARLNASLPVTKESQGIGRKPRYATEAVRWAEILLNVPETRAKLLDMKARNSKLSPDAVRGLMAYHDDRGGPDIREVFPLPTAAPAPPQPVDNARIENLRVKKQRDAERAAMEAQRVEKAQDHERKLIDAVGKQLSRVLGIERTNWRGTKKTKL